MPPLAAMRHDLRNQGLERHRGCGPRGVLQNGSVPGRGFLDLCGVGNDRPIDQVAVGVSQLGFKVPAPPVLLAREMSRPMIAKSGCARWRRTFSTVSLKRLKPIAA